MSTPYERLLQNLNVVKWELKCRNDQSLNLCIKYVKDAIVEAMRLNYDLEKAQAVLELQHAGVDLDVLECDD